MAAAKKDPKLGAILLGIGKPKDKGTEAEGDAYEAGDGETAMADLREALDSGDDAMAYEAFERAVKICNRSKGVESAPAAEDDDGG